MAKPIPDGYHPVTPAPRRQQELFAQMARRKP
jgi:hypothetical protein